MAETERITSLKNPKVMLWRSLKERKARKETGLFLAEGRKMTDEALASGFAVEAVLAADSVSSLPAAPESIPIFLLPDHVFSAVCDTKTPQGVAAVVRMKTAAAEGLRLVALDGVQDPGNVGTIIRTADCAGFSGVILSTACADPSSPKVLRATMGSIFRMPVTVTDDLPGMLRGLRDRAGYTVISSQLDGTPFYARKAVGERFCLIVGSEGSGVSPEVRETATMRLRLPMRGGAESLNAAAAAAIMMYDLTRALPE